MARQIKRHNYANLDETELNNLIREQTHKLLDNSQPHRQLTCNIDMAVKKIETAVNDALDTLAPITMFSVTKCRPHWITQALKDKIRCRDKLHKRARRTQSIFHFQIYRQFRGKLQLELRRTKHEYYYNKLSTISDQSRMWRELSSLGLVNAKNLSPLHFFTCDQLSQYYAGDSLSTRPCSAHDLTHAISKINNDSPTFLFDLMELPDVHQVLMYTLSNSYTMGPDQLSPFIIKKLGHILSPILLEIFNNSITESTFPFSWKRAYLKPLLKVLTPKSPKDTRPIANLCEFSKIFEPLLHKQIMHHFESTNNFDPYQSGYRTSYSTQTALLKLCHDVRKSADERKITILVLFDFSKAFDTVPHALLLVKLAQLGISDKSLSWIYSYLTGRTQVVIDSITNAHSQSTNVNIGVPQGSVLGPLLFMLYINDICAKLHFSKHIVYADDTQIYLDTWPSNLINSLNDIKADINEIANFAREHYLKLNLAKSKIIIIGSPYYVNAINYGQLPPIMINGQTIPYVDHTKNLGVIISSNLTWTKNTSYVSSKIHSTLHRLKSNKNSLPRLLRIKLVKTLIFPLMDYCCTVYNDCTKVNDNKLQRLINPAIRFIFDLKRDTHIKPYRLQLKWLNVKNRRQYFMGIIIYNILQNDAPQYLIDIFQKKNLQVRSSSRVFNNEIFHMPHHRTNTYQNSFHIQSVYFWHNLPSHITNCTSVTVLKFKLFDHLLNSEMSEIQST